MFIIRVQTGRPDDEASTSEMYEASTYRTERGPSGVRLILVLEDKSTKEIDIVCGMQAWAMNDQGKTIEPIKPRTPEVQERMSKIGG